jgi:hypothetical protein
MGIGHNNRGVDLNNKFRELATKSERPEGCSTVRQGAGAGEWEGERDTCTQVRYL